MTIYCLIFGVRNISREDVHGKRVLEIGALDVNGSLRVVVEQLQPAEYIGTDIQSGRGVDRICDVTDLIKIFGAESFDVVICTELMEHVRDWRKALHNIKNVCSSGGVILLTTRSRGFEYHAYPYDYWRYEESDIRKMFSDCDIESIGIDREWGVCIKARKPELFIEKDLSGVKLYSIVTGKTESDIKDADFEKFHFRVLMLRKAVRDFLCKTIGERLLPK
jgi:SAM-dependent methyltransferase